MFGADIYVQRRKSLKSQMASGVLLFLGNRESPMNYPDNAYPFRQDSTFLYYWGLDFPGLAAIIDLDDDKEIIFGDSLEVDDIIWMGPQPTLEEKAEQVGIAETQPSARLHDFLKSATGVGKKVHFLPQYRPESMIRMEQLLGIAASELNKNTSEAFIKAVVSQRSIKAPEEITEIEASLEIAFEMHTSAMRFTKPGMTEREIAGIINGIASSKGAGNSFPTIFSIHGEILHNHSQHNIMKEGDLVVNDSGAESVNHYASDLTRTFPVSGKFSQRQKDIYQIVLNAQLTAIKAIEPRKKYRDVHLLSAKEIAEGLKELDLLKGNTDDIVQQGAHALFFPHGLGHMMGLDVHDMENLGEDYVGYDAGTQRSEQFGLAYLRMAKALQPGYVLTVEPGIYFIPALIDRWKSEKKFTDFINYAKLGEWQDFGGVRIEDNVLVTENGNRVLGKPVPKTIDAVEAECASG